MFIPLLKFADDDGGLLIPFRNDDVGLSWFVDDIEFRNEDPKPPGRDDDEASCFCVGNGGGVAVSFAALMGGNPFDDIEVP